MSNELGISELWEAVNLLVELQENEGTLAERIGVRVRVDLNGRCHRAAAAADGWTRSSIGHNREYACASLLATLANELVKSTINLDVNGKKQ